jgi:hypothetical protein
MSFFNNLGGTNLFFDENRETTIGKLIVDHLCHKVLLHYDPMNSKIRGLVEIVKRSLIDYNIMFYELPSHLNKPNIDTVFDGIKLGHTYHIDFVLVIGHQSLVSTGKCIACGCLYSDNIFTMFKKNDSIRASLPIGIVSTDICCGKSIYDEAYIYHMSSGKTLDFFYCKSHYFIPQFVIFNPLYASPSDNKLGYTMIRLLFISLLCYFTLQKEDVLKQRYVECTLETILLMFDVLRKKPEDFEAKRNIMLASINFYTNPVIELEGETAIDLLARAIVCQYGCDLEISYSILIPAFLRFMLERRPYLVSKLGTRAFNVPYNFEDYKKTSSQTISVVENIILENHMPIHITDLGGNAGDFANILKLIGFSDNIGIGKNEQFSKLECEVILSLTL